MILHKSFKFADILLFFAKILKQRHSSHVSVEHVYSLNCNNAPVLERPGLFGSQHFWKWKTEGFIIPLNRFIGMKKSYYIHFCSRCLDRRQGNCLTSVCAQQAADEVVEWSIYKLHLPPAAAETCITIPHHDQYPRHRSVYLRDSLSTGSCGLMGSDDTEQWAKQSSQTIHTA